MVKSLENKRFKCYNHNNKFIYGGSMFQFKNNLQLGVATASAQIEGGEVGSNWNTYSDAGKISDGSNIKRANDHWNRYKEDAELLSSLGIRNYRMSVEWARIEPKQGEFDYGAIQHYRKEIQYLHSLGISVLVTLYHFSHPQWFEDMGAFASAKNIDVFLRFVHFTVEQLGDLVSEWCTLNEPNVYAVNSFMLGEWLNEEKNLRKTIKVMNIFIACHLESYRLIHDIAHEKGFAEPAVSLAMHYRHFDPLNNSLIDKIGANKLNFLFQEGMFRACATGRFTFPFKNIRHFEKGQYIDFIALNYYTRGLVDKFSDTVKQDAYKNDLGWEIYPEGIVKSMQNMYSIIKLPIRITENGTCDNNDSFRPLYIYEHLKAITESDLPVTHYYHWCFVDNFEWKEGELPRFGLVHCNYDTQERTLKRSAYMYKEMIAENGVSDEIYKKYIEGCSYHKGENNILRGILSDEELVNKR